MQDFVTFIHIKPKDIYVNQHKVECWQILDTHEYLSKDGNKLAIKTLYKKPNGLKIAT